MFNRMLIAYNRIYSFNFDSLQAFASQVYHGDGFFLDLISCLPVLRIRMESVPCGRFSKPRKRFAADTGKLFLSNRFSSNKSLIEFSAFSHLLDGVLGGLF
jgi:hypothetical protein